MIKFKFWNLSKFWGDNTWKVFLFPNIDIGRNGIYRWVEFSWLVLAFIIEYTPKKGGDK